MNELRNTYSNIDAAQLQADAESSLLNYGTKYHPEIITHAKEHYIYTVSGHARLDIRADVVPDWAWSS